MNAREMKQILDEADKALVDMPAACSLLHLRKEAARAAAASLSDAKSEVREAEAEVTLLSEKINKALALARTCPPQPDVIVRGKPCANDGWNSHCGPWSEGWHVRLTMPRCPDCDGELVAVDMNSPSHLACVGRRVFSGGMSAERGCGSQFVVTNFDGNVVVSRKEVNESPE